MKRTLLWGCILLLGIHPCFAKIQRFPGHWSRWQKAVFGSYCLEDFEDTSLNAGLSVVSTYPGHIDSSKGVWWDRLVYSDGEVTYTTWEFSQPIYAFGGTWNLAGPDGPGSNIEVLINGSWLSIGVIDNSYENVFWGFVTDLSFTKVRLRGYNSEGWCETYELDDLVYAFWANVHLSSSVGGQVTSLGEGDFMVPLGEKIKLKAEADPLFEFLRWQGTLTGSSNPYQYLTVTNDHDIRAIFQSTLDVLYVDDNAPNDVGPYSLSVSDPAENGTKDHPFDSIQEAAEVAKPGSTVVVLPGTYGESLLLRSKAIAVTSTDPDSNEPVLEYPVIQAPDDEPVVSFQFCTDPTMVLEGLVLTGANDNSASGIKSLRSDVVIKNCLIAGNRRRTSGSAGGGALSCSHSEVILINCTLTENYGGINGAGIYANSTSTVTIMDSILWGNQPTEILTDASSSVSITSSDVTGGYAGAGNLDINPAFVASGYWEHALNPGMVVLPSHHYAVWAAGDYHLTEGSSCVDAGDALSDYGQEPEPNGGQVNMGAYGNTPQAAMTPTP